MGDCSCQGVRVTTSTLILVDSSELWRVKRDAYERLLSLPVSPILFFPGPERPDSFPRLGKPISPAPSLVWRSQVTFQKSSVSCPSALFPLSCCLEFIARRVLLWSSHFSQGSYYNPLLSTSSIKQWSKILSLVTESTKLALFMNTVFLINPC